MLLTATGPGVAPGIRYAGWRILPHVASPKSWGLPVDLGLVVEISFQDQRYEENTRQIELRPIVQKNIDRYQFGFNPVFERGLKGHIRFIPEWTGGSSSICFATSASDSA